MARGWKRAAELLIARSGIATLYERRARPSTVILSYHNVVPRGEKAVGDMSLHVDQSDFADQLDFILEDRTVVSLEEAFDSSPAEPRSRVAITFDDAYAGCMSAGLEELQKRGLPSTVFVPPGELGTDGFWWDRLAPPDGGPLDGQIRSHALVALRGQREPVLEWAGSENVPIQDVPEHARPVTEDALRSDPRADGVTFGAHTWSHPNLVALEPQDVALELTRSRDWLSSETDRYVDWFAYPYGLHDDGVVDAASAVFDGAFLIEGGAAERNGRVEAQKHRMPRIDVPRGMSLDGLALRLGGVL